MKKFVCSVCGYIYEGEEPPKTCPQCGAPKEKFTELKESVSFACEHEVGIAKNVEKDVYEDLKANFLGECSEVGTYLAMRRQADREGYPEIADAFQK